LKRHCCAAHLKEYAIAWPEDPVAEAGGGWAPARKFFPASPFVKYLKF